MPRKCFSGECPTCPYFVDGKCTLLNMKGTQIYLGGVWKVILSDSEVEEIGLPENCPLFKTEYVAES